ncbi:MAG TPA: GAF and ANTAR domain-containing protein [Frankiaceae bacterium]|nr:GAF and ANTAR domain-containing protein [Frankiaceae bacterium]
MPNELNSSTIITKINPLDPTGTLAQLSTILTSAQTLDAVLDDIVVLAKSRIPGADEVSMTMIDKGRPSTVASTGNLAVDMDQRQYDSGWGPCLDAADTGQMLVVEDMSTETRWPEFRDRGREIGIASSMSTPMPLQQHVGAALNAYARTPHSFDESSREWARAFAEHAALALAHAYRYTQIAHQAESLREAMRSRAVIEQAKGILMAARRMTADDAFNVLVQISQTRHIKLRQLAAQVVSQASGHAVSLDES